jgi:hypothetical protein
MWGVEGDGVVGKVGEARGAVVCVDEALQLAKVRDDAGQNAGLALSAARSLSAVRCSYPNFPSLIDLSFFIDHTHFFVCDLSLLD